MNAPIVELTASEQRTLMILWACGPGLAFADISGRFTAAGLVQDGALTDFGRRVAAALVLEDPGATELGKKQARADLGLEPGPV